MVLVNGFPKSGTHALWKACYLLGINAEHGHFQPDELPACDRHLFIKRDPRNVLASAVRAGMGRIAQEGTGFPLNGGSFTAALRDFNGEPFCDQLAKMEPWLDAPACHIVSYEDLIASDTAMRGIANYCDVPYIDGAFELLPGHTRTWNERHVDWRSIWSENVERAWGEAGGAAVVKRWGYV